MSFIIQRGDGSARRVSGYKFAAPRPGTKKYGGERLGNRALPPKVDLRPYLTTIENQGETNSCVANAVAGAYEYLVKRHLEEDAYDVSRLFIYYNARALERDDIKDEGSIIANAIEGLKEHGACSEETWPFDKETVNEEPSEEAYEEAQQFVIEDTEQVPTNLEAWKRCLAEGYPIIFGISLYKSFDAQRQKGLVPMPTDKEAARGSHGGHAMLCVGYSDADKVFIVRNSWGTNWGDNGYCYIPYRYLISEKHNGGDSWIIRRLETLEVDEDTWGDDSPVIEELSHELADMDEKAYHALLDAMGDVPLETRLAVLFLQAAGVDGDISDEELEGIAEYLGEVLEAMGLRLEPQKVLKHCLRYIENEDLLEETVELLGNHLSKAALAGIVARLEEVVSADDLSEDEESFLDELIELWQVAEDGDEDEDEEEEEDEDDDEDEEDEDEDDR
ncbi:C1 family peptidase [Vitiosangium sp. GDMCC 1.1324]|uniref:C1 family peptidase n=1 Tax=Vitiosangium sp. (strain GDMCC 1.1324) TaxID=2138576 RepID=UPI000D3D1E6A|nr:C1 family peptidase [Vitiosangium sp. GDMCC 1.1324]PTL80303.1 peptidase C1 [Vitiosangium sp. GDMCC 1.1324]